MTKKLKLVKKFGIKRQPFQNYYEYIIYIPKTPHIYHYQYFEQI